MKSSYGHLIQSMCVAVVWWVYMLLLQFWLHNREEDIEGDVISNPTAGEDDPQTKVKFCSDVSTNLLQS